MMNGVNIRLSNSFDASDMLTIFSEDELVVAPVRIECPMNARDREVTPINGDDFDEAYNNETGNVERGIPRLVVSVLAPSYSYDAIPGPHYIPFYSEGVVLTEDNLRADAKENTARHQLVVAVENLATMLTVMGREVFVPVAPYTAEPAEGNLLEDQLNMSKINPDILPGYWCYPFRPGYTLHKIECVYPDKIRGQGKKFVDPIMDIAIVEALSRKTPTDAGDEWTKKTQKLLELYQTGMISRQAMMKVIEEGSNYEADKIITTCSLRERSKEAAFDPEDIKKSTGKRGKHCPECGKLVNGRCDGCQMIYGRRGWRQLGVYDG
jgi:hypothetical protein